MFYEKFAQRAEEGVFELFCEFAGNGGKSFFVIDPSGTGYSRIASTPGVIPKFSLKYYWVLYRADVYVGTEVPTHLSLLRSNNHWLRKRFYERPYVFLQHGIIFMKNLGKTSVFVKDREGEPSYIVASSKKEQAIIERDLQISPSRVLVTGLGQFSLITRNHISGASPDIVTVMLTWRPYDESISDFTESDYFRSLNEVMDSLDSRIPVSHIRIVAHPKVESQLQNTPVAPLLWTATVSEALAETKLLITDYSSACYNAFYQGSGVIFYQRDLAKYEEHVGPLIPQNDEYIGHRALDRRQLQHILKTAIHLDGTIRLNTVRLPIHVKRYTLINEFSDGKNLERIQKELKKIYLTADDRM